ncbi:sensor histidine kinase [Bacillus sp. FJAT-42376]|uniref:HAMP domain-containing sensor histidine kinase n=1 Tax=Bacillus sp. FJAT-42376 TaxID=2014076 RepID=UPI000F4F1ECD|nr:HAMP domain-containing sensor histidine kinase [Bacillus sp. FJAT-42376]AZB41547.1 sensor histidine kinase [Bacillus sp. FJAT-42376]
MFTKNKKRTTLLKYWTTRYLFSLCIGLLILGIGSFWWIRQTTIENRLNLLEYLAAESADAADGQTNFKDFDRRMDQRARVLDMGRPPQIFIANNKGVLVRGPHRGPGPEMGPEKLKLPAAFFSNNDTVQRLTINGTSVYTIKEPIVIGSEQKGWIVVMQTEDELADVNQEYRLIAILLIGLGLLGWLVIYLLSKRILKPIQEVALAAAEIKEGQYEVKLNSDVREQEIYDLVTSFEDMTQRLIQLEKLRAELLAGVTHDLKTPVTSISGLVQAVRDGIVTGEERQEFLDITLKEIHRLQTMIADLLDFNSLSAGAFTIHPETCNMNELIHTIVRQWSVTQQNEVHYEVNTPEQIVILETDSLRLEQILINLLNNSSQAMAGKGQITVSLFEDRIEVADNGPGIPVSEQPYIFERFFRGEEKKLKVRGLGLGLPFSRMLAKAMGGELVLKESGRGGSVFSVKLR